MFLFRVAVVSLLLVSSALAAGENELIMVLSARTRYALANRKQLPDQPPDMQNRNLQRSAAPTSGTIEQQLLETQRELAQLKALASQVVCPIPQSAPPARCPKCGDNCPQCGDNCKCGANCLCSVPASMSFSAAGPRGPKLKVRCYCPKVCSPGCIHCERSSKTADNCGGGDEFLEIEYIAGEPPANVVRSQQGKTYPFLAVEDSAGKTWSLAGEVYTLESLHAQLAKIPSLPSPPQAMGASGSIRTGGKIRQALNFFSQYLGPDATVEITWDRTGQQSLSATKLMHGQPWTPEMVAGNYGRVMITTTSTRLPLGLKKFECEYQIENGRLTRLKPGPIDLPATAFSQRDAAAAKAYGLDPLTLGWGLFSLFDVLHQLLNPQVDVGLPGRVQLNLSMEGPDKLSAAFYTPVSIRVAAWFKFDLGVERVDVTPANVHLQFTPQPRNWIRIDSKDIAVDDGMAMNAAAAADDRNDVLWTAAVQDDSTDPGNVGITTYSAMPGRSPQWHRVRDEYFASHPHCEFKGCRSEGPFNVHHVRPFHTDPKLELDPGNLITLCRGGINHHLWVGHNGDFKDVNPYVREDCQRGHWPSKGLYQKERHDQRTHPAKTLAP